MPKQTDFRQVEINPDRDLLTVQELAYCLRVSDRYVYEMRSKGFPMPAGTATVNEARAWLKNTGFRMKSGSGVKVSR